MSSKPISESLSLVKSWLGGISDSDSDSDNNNNNNNNTIINKKSVGVGSVNRKETEIERSILGKKRDFKKTNEYKEQLEEKLKNEKLKLEILEDEEDSKYNNIKKKANKINNNNNNNKIYKIPPGSKEKVEIPTTNIEVINKDKKDIANQEKQHIEIQSRKINNKDNKVKQIEKTTLITKNNLDISKPKLATIIEKDNILPSVADIKVSEVSNATALPSKFKGPPASKSAINKPEVSKSIESKDYVIDKTPQTIVESATEPVFKKKKLRSKQKNLKRDRRPDHLKPCYRTVLPQTQEYLNKL